MDLNTVFDLKTVGGVAAATLVLVEFIKSQVKGTRLDSIPLAVWIISVAGGLTLVAYQSGLAVQQTWSSFLLSSIASALSASGLFTWVTMKPFKTGPTEAPPPDDNSRGGGSSIMGLVLVGGILLISLTGCGAAMPRERAFYEGVRAGWDQISPEYRRYVAADPSLAPEDKLLRIGEKNSLVAEMDGLLADEQKAITNGDQ